jgi:serine/threonine protein kinase
VTTIQKDGLANVPKTFGNYRIGRVIGEGGTAIAAEAFDRETGQSYGVKIIEKMASNASGAVEREIRVLKGLKHASVVKLIEVVQEEKSIFVVLENCLLSGRKTGVSEVKRLFGDFASAVGHLHSEGIAPGDLKPDNIVLTKS